MNTNDLKIIKDMYDNTPAKDRKHIRISAPDGSNELSDPSWSDVKNYNKRYKSVKIEYHD